MTGGSSDAILVGIRVPGHSNGPFARPGGRGVGPRRSPGGAAGRRRERGPEILERRLDVRRLNHRRLRPELQLVSHPRQRREAVGDPRQLDEVAGTERRLQQAKLARAPFERPLERRDPPFEAGDVRPQSVGVRGVVESRGAGLDPGTPVALAHALPAPPDEAQQALHQLPAARVQHGLAEADELRELRFELRQVAPRTGARIGGRQIGLVGGERDPAEALASARGARAPRGPPRRPRLRARPRAARDPGSRSRS